MIDKIKIMQAFDNGLLIERCYKISNDVKWIDDIDPSWNWEKFVYRIKQGVPLEIRIIYTGTGDSFEVNADSRSILEELMRKGTTTFKEVFK